uniref:Uncharacterized protein n=1 Tax=Oryza glumipatula TaxID=40148 RepID=A0A0D9YN01_9ORYZ
MELGLLMAPSPGAPTSMAGRTVRDSIDTTGGYSSAGALVPLGRSRSPASSAPSPPALNVSRQITGTLTDLTLRAIMGECGFRWREEFLKTLGEAQKKKREGQGYCRLEECKLVSHTFAGSSAKRKESKVCYNLVTAGIKVSSLEMK